MGYFKIVLGLIAFAFGTAAGVLFGKNHVLGNERKVNPLIGSAGVSAIPMGGACFTESGKAEADPTNFLLMHAIGQNVAGVIGTGCSRNIMAIFGVK